MTGTKNILVVTQWSFKDPLIQSYTLPYVHIIAEQLPKGSKIYLLTFEQDRLKMHPEEMNEIKKQLAQKGIILLDHSYSQFGIISLIKLFIIILQLLTTIFFRRIRFIHAWCTPAGSLGYFLSIFSGRPLIIDSYEPHAEAMVENGTWEINGLKFKTLFYLEKKLSSRAKTIISATAGMRDYALKKYGVTFHDFYVKPACVDLDQFNVSKRKDPVLLKELALESKIVCVYAGKFGGIYLTKEVFELFHLAEKTFGDDFRVLLLTPHDKDELIRWAIESNFNTDKMIVKSVPHDLIPEYIGLGDFAITPVKPIPTKRYCTPIKDGEYWALGLPVIITEGISDDSDIIRENKAGAVISTLTDEGYMRSLNEMKILLSESKDIISKRITDLAKKFRSFQIAEDIYRKIYKD